MNDTHLDADGLNRLLVGGYPAKQVEHWLFHLLFCEDCRRFLLRAHPEEGPLFLEQIFGASENWINPRGYLAQDDRLRSEVLDSPILIDELAQQSEPRRLLLVKNLARFQSVPVAVACLTEAKRLWQHEPREALSWISLSLSVLDSLPPGRYPSELVFDFQARAWAYRANALRNLSAFDEANQAFDMAWQLFWRGTRVPSEWAHLAALEASLRRDQRKFGQADSLLEDAIGIYQHLGEYREEARLLVARAFVSFEEGRLEDAVKILQDVLRRAEHRELDREVYAAALHNLAYNLAHLGRGAEARRLFPKVRDLVQSQGNAIQIARLHWLEALIYRAEGDFDRAEASFRKVHRKFVDLGIAYDAALVSLDLAVLYLETGRLQEVKELAAEMLPIFRSRQIHREAAVAGLVLIEALRQEAATVESIREVAAYIERGRSQARSN